jgi:hypothetical protein
MPAQIMNVKTLAVQADWGTVPSAEIAYVWAQQAGLLPPCPQLQDYRGAYIIGLADALPVSSLL